MFSSTQSQNVNNAMKDNTSEPNCFSFDLDRIKEAVNAPAIDIPANISDEDFLKLIKSFASN